MTTLRTFTPALISTILVWIMVGVGVGWAGLLAVIVLTFLEMTFSFDNAVVNSKLLVSMSLWWQRAFLTVGILIAVFAVRFALPVVLVAAVTGLGFGSVVQLALDNPAQYEIALVSASPVIYSFGGVFLLLISLAFFLDQDKDVHWVAALEKRLAMLGRLDNVGVFVVVIIALALAWTAPGDATLRLSILIAAMCGVALHVGLGLFGAVAGDGATTKHLVGFAALVMFIRLEVLDASFSFDGLVGAFAVTTNVILVLAGLACGAFWVRSLTVYMVRVGSLNKYQYLAHGAHTAIGALGLVMLLKLYHVELSQWVVGPLGLVFVALAIWSSLRERRRAEVQELATASG